MRILFLLTLALTFAPLSAPAPAQDDVGYAANGEMVSFDAATLPATTAFERIARSMGSSFILNESVKGNVTLDFRNVYYSEAFTRVAERAKVKLAKAGNLFVIGNALTSSEVELHGAIAPPDPALEADLAAEGENRDYLTFQTGDEGMSVPGFVQFVSRSSGVKIECDPKITHRVFGVFRAVHWRNLVDATCALCELEASGDEGHLSIRKKRN